MGCGDSCVKYILFFFNLLFALCGLVILGLGIAFKLNLSYITDIIPDNRVTVQPIIFIIIGSIVFLISFFGCCGAVRESHCMLVTYAICMIVIIIAQVIVAIIVFVYIGDIEEALSKALMDSFKLRDKEPTQGAWNLMEEQLKCCGVKGYTDYGLAATLPPSCCDNKGQIAETCLPVGIGVHPNGCLTELTSYIKMGGNTIAGIAIGVAVVEVISVIFSLCFANTIRNAERRSRY